MKFSVLSVKDGRDLTARASGTSYLVFGGVGIPEPNLLAIDDATAVMTAAGSLGQYNRRSVIVFARNGDLVGWTELKIVHASGKTTGNDRTNLDETCVSSRRQMMRLSKKALRNWTRHGFAVLGLVILAPLFAQRILLPASPSRHQSRRRRSVTRSSSLWLGPAQTALTWM